MKKNTIQLVLILLVGASAIVRLFHITGFKWLELLGGISFLALLILWAINARRKPSS